MKVTFFGSSRYVIPVIEALKRDFNLSLVVTTEKLPSDPIISYCIRHKVQRYIAADFWQENLIEKIKEIKPDVGVLASFGGIIPKKILDLFPNGILNIHPSLLPKYRGPTPVQTAILNRDKKTGVTIIKLDEEVDHGPILAQEEEPILDTDTGESLMLRLFEKGAHILSSVVQSELNKPLKGVPQDDSKATITKRLTRQNGYIDIQNPPDPKILNRMVRAYYPWPGVWFRSTLNNKQVVIKILPASPSLDGPASPSQGGPEKIQVEGKKPMSFVDFINGYLEGRKILSSLKILN